MDQQNNAYQTPAVYEDTAPLSVGNYIVMFLITAIPIVGLVMLFVWSFGGSVNTNKKNWARASLILALIGIVLSIIFSSMLMAALVSAGNSMRQ